MKKLIALIALLWFVGCGSGGTAVTSSDVVAEFRKAGLEAESPAEMAAQDYGAAPFVGEGTRFLIPSLGEGKGGRVVVTDNRADADNLANYYTSLGEGSAAFFSWVFQKDNIIVQINGELPEDQARQYEAALNAME